MQGEEGIKSRGGKRVEGGRHRAVRRRSARGIACVGADEAQRGERQNFAAARRVGQWSQKKNEQPKSVARGRSGA